MTEIARGTPVDRENPYVAPDAELSVATENEVPRTFRRSVWLGVKAGVKWTSYVFGPLCLIGLLFSMGFLVYVVMRPNGLLQLAHDPSIVARMLGGPFAVFGLICGYGAIIGSVVGAGLHVVRRIAARLRRKWGG